MAIGHLTRFADTTTIPSCSAAEVAQFFISNIFLRHGAPHILLSDRGRTFLSNTIKKVFAACHVLHKTMSSYHQQTNSLTERFHCTLAEMVSMYVSKDHKNWDVILPFVTFAYNTAVQNTTGYFPYHLVYARKPKSFVDRVLQLTPTTHCNILHSNISRDEHFRHLVRLGTTALQLRKLWHDSLIA